MLDLLNQAKNDLKEATGQPAGAPSTEDLLSSLKLEFPPDERITYLDSFKDMLPTADYEYLRKMITTFDLSKEELDEELERYGISPEDTCT